MNGLLCHTCGEVAAPDNVTYEYPDGWIYVRVIGNDEQLFCSMGCLRRWSDVARDVYL